MLRLYTQINAPHRPLILGIQLVLVPIHKLVDMETTPGLRTLTVYAVGVG